MTKNLLIIFVKNSTLGKVKTRLAKTIGNTAALLVYNKMVEKIEKTTAKINLDKHIYFSDKIVEDKWEKDEKFVQNGNDLGEKMQNSFLNSFALGYRNVVLIGADIPEITTQIITQAFKELESENVVFGPAQDGGYYLVGLHKMYSSIFENKAWSTSNLLDLTLQELTYQNTTYSLLSVLNDIDNYSDLSASKFCINDSQINKIIKLNESKTVNRNR